MTADLFLVHGGLWDAMDATRFWRTPGIVAGLESAGLTVIAPDRPRVPGSWSEEVDELGALLPGRPVTLVGASNGCSVAAGLALAYPEAVGQLLLAWPATGGDASVDERTRAGLLGRGAPEEVADGLLRGGTLRGVADQDLAGLRIPVAVLPSMPENPPHQRKTVDALLALIPGSRELPGCPEPPTPNFPPHRDALVEAIVAFANRPDQKLT
jgi:pimeloyl-ACP methyl ester carboxylesterase